MIKTKMANDPELTIEQARAQVWLEDPHRVDVSP